MEGKAISEVLINEQIREKEVRVVSESGEQLGVMSSKEAQLKADDLGVDMVMIAPKAQPPVVKLIDYGKYKYEAARREKEAKKNQKIINKTTEKELK